MNAIGSVKKPGMYNQEYLFIKTRNAFKIGGNPGIKTNPGHIKIICEKLKLFLSKCLVTTISLPAPFIASQILPNGILARIKENPIAFLFELGEDIRNIPIHIIPNEKSGPASVAIQEIR